MKPILYLDLDETILFRGFPVHNSYEFFEWCTRYFEVRWLTRWCPDGIMDDHQSAVLSERFHGQITPEEIKKYNNPKGFLSFKNDGVDHSVSRPWVWVENSLDGGEDEILRKSGFYGHYFKTNLHHDEDPEASDNAIARTWKKLSEAFNFPLPSEQETPMTRL